MIQIYDANHGHLTWASWNWVHLLLGLFDDIKAVCITRKPNDCAFPYQCNEHQACDNNVQEFQLLADGPAIGLTV